MPAPRKATTCKRSVGEPVEPTTPPQERLVDGLGVVKIEPELSPMTNRAGKRSPFLNREVLTLEDGSTVYGCTQCWVTDKNRGQIMRHYKEVHAEKRAAKSARSDRDAAIAQMTLGELFLLAGGVADWESERTRLMGKLAATQAELTELKATHGRLTRALDKAGFVLKLED